MIRRYREADAPAVKALNAACVPEVGPLDDERLERFAEWAPYFMVVDVGGAAGVEVGGEVGGQIVALMVGLGEDAPYASPNFGWFVQRYPLFAYVDRVAVAEDHRGEGWGPALYRDFERWAVDNQKPMLCAEVNVEPPNPRSLRFHEIFGFETVGQFEPDGSAEHRVAMMVKEIDADLA